MEFLDPACETCRAFHPYIERLMADNPGTIKQDLEDAKTLGVRTTPGYLVNGKPLRTFGYAQLKALVEAEINEVY